MTSSTRRPALGTPTVRARQAAAGRLPAVHRHDPGGHGARRRPADRPRAGAVPAVVGAGWRRPGRRRVREANPPTSCWRCLRSRPSGRRPWSSARTWAPWRRASGGARHRPTCCPRGLPCSSRGRRGLAAEGHGRHHCTTTCRPWPGPGPRRLCRPGAGRRAGRSALALLRRRLARVAGLPPDAPLADVIEGVHAAVGAAPSVLAVATLEDALRLRRRPNLPGTGRAQRDNWSRALPAAWRR